MKSTANLVQPDMFETPKRKRWQPEPPKAYGPEDFPTAGFVSVDLPSGSGMYTVSIPRSVIHSTFSSLAGLRFSRERARALFLREPDTTGLTILTDTDLKEKSNER